MLDAGRRVPRAMAVIQSMRSRFGGERQFASTGSDTHRVLARVSILGHDDAVNDAFIRISSRLTRRRICSTHYAWTSSFSMSFRNALTLSDVSTGPLFLTMAPILLATADADVLNFWRDSLLNDTPAIGL